MNYQIEQQHPVVRFETFNDGTVKIYKLKDVSDPGMQPRLAPVLYRNHAFAYKTIGTKQNYEAMQASVRLDEKIRIHLDRGISPQDIAVVDNIQYEIVQLQHIMTTKPATTVIYLQRREEIYDELL